ncbi:PHD finger protein 20 isoform X2 [Microplitis demolitor]|uniref:PHD finger protein 20 isoform X2 n=1 Tax=Microplitis demolitor TaxID=69319 RepID=UPI0006D4E2FA|nr:PHD finger protein 20 isoform X2 [Microplitis demolitor]
MARKCCVKNCEINGSDVHAVGIPIHRFPKDQQLKCKWLKNAGFSNNYKPLPGQFVCFRHFCKNDYEKVNKNTANSPGHKFLLKKGSVPTIFDNYENHPDPIIPFTKSSELNNSTEDSNPVNIEMTQMEKENSHETELSNSKPDAEKSKPASEESKKETSKNLPINTDNKSESIKKSPPSSDNLSTENTQNVVDTAVEKKEFTEDPPAKPPPLSNDSIVKSEISSNSNNKSNGSVEKNTAVKKTSGDNKNGKNTKSGKNKTANKLGLKFYPGAKLEAKDFNEKWYAARVVETDWAEREVLIHFDKWSSRYNEWIPMDSSRLRSFQMQPRDTKMREFAVGERILATWADGRKYPAKVNAVLGDDKYDVLFDDGYAKIVRSSKMTKIASTSSKNSSKTMESESYIGSKQERRDKSRKHSVVDLFSHKKRTKADGVDKSLNKKDDSVVVNDNNEQLNNSDSVNDSADATGGELDDSSSEVLQGFENSKPKVRNGAKRKREVVNDYDDDTGPEWVDGEPQGVESFAVDGNEGSRRSIIIPDKKLPPGWQKHFIQRKTGSSAGKWDVVFFHEPTSKKFRSRNDLKVFFESQRPNNYDPDKFDFCIHRRKKTVSAKAKTDAGTSGSSNPPTTNEVPKKIKTLLPKSKTATTNDLLLTPVTNNYSTPNPAPVEDTAVFIGGLRVEMENSAYKCPKDGCAKTLRNENLLQMHIKHYHPEFSKYLGSTPNVADLAYARTIGEPIIDATPKKSINNYSDKPTSRFDKRKTNSDKFSSSLNHSLSQSFAASSPLSVASPDTSQIDSQLNGLKDDMKLELMSPGSSASLDIDDELTKKSDGSCAMSPGSLFDMKSKEEKTQAGIKTLLPLRPANSVDTTRMDRSKSLDDTFNSDRGQRKRQLSEYSSDASTKSKKRHGIQELTDDYGDLDDSALDTEGPTPLMYRFSRRKSDSKSDDNSQNGDGVMMMINGEMVKVEQLKREEIINCTCGIVEEDGLMIQCDLCLCWQHGHCNAIEREKDVPEKYICYICRHPYRQRPSKKYIHDQDWIKEGKLQSLSKRTKNQDTINKRAAMLKRSYDLVGALIQIQQILHSLRVKINVAQNKDHPKLYLWAKNWEKSELPKPNVEPIPIMEIIKSEPVSPDTDTDVCQSDMKSEPIDSDTKEEINCDRSIHSDSELMKILEEDNNPSADEPKIKKENSIKNNKEDNLLTPTATNGDDKIPQKSNKTDGPKVKSKDDTENLNSQSGEPSTDNQMPFAAVNGDDSLNVNDNEQVIQSSKGFESTLQDKPAMPQPFIPEPEAPIDPDECRLRLLDHVDHFQNHIEARLTGIEAQVSLLEAMDPDSDLPLDKVELRVKETMKMLLRDLNTVRKLASLC